jgi:hypothetical protein
MPPYDATVTKNLREAGAIIIAKTQLTELANWVTVGMPANYNSLNGYGMNPYDPRRDPRDGLADGRPVLTPAARAPASAPLSASGRQMSAPRRPVRSSARQSEHAGRHQADGWAREPLRHHSNHG